MTDSSKGRYRDFLAARARTEADGPAGSGEHPAGATDPGARRHRRRGYLRDYYRWLRPFRGALAGILSLASVAAGLGLVLPIATRYAVDDIILGSKNLGALALFGGGMLGLTILQQATEVVRMWRMAVLNARVIHRLRQRLFVHFVHLPLEAIGDLKTGGIVSRLSGDCDQVTGLLQMAIITPIVAVLRVIATIVVLFFLSWKMAIAAIVFLPPIAALNMLWIRRIRPIYRSMRKDRSAIDGRVVESFGGIRTVRAFSRERSEARAYALGHHTVIRKTVLARLNEIVIISGWGVLIPVASVVIIWYGGYLSITTGLTIGSILAFQMYVMSLLHPVSQIVQSFGQTQQGLAAMERVFDALEMARDKPDRAGAAEAPAVVKSLAFESVSFSYRPGTPVLQDIDLRVEAGKTVALVGASGAGKTTFTNLVARFYDPDEGVIRVNGVDVRDLQLTSYRRLLALVQQDVFLFDGTVRENIGFGRRGASEDEVREAAARANAHDFITAFPEGYDTLVGERGVKLSGGQAQRISIARALLADPQILILDEATSNLDSESESLIQAALETLIANRTTFVIAHRLSTIVDADLIAVFDGGRIVETGTHDDLIARRGLYKKMVAQQFARAESLGA